MKGLRLHVHFKNGDEFVYTLPVDEMASEETIESTPFDFVNTFKGLDAICFEDINKKGVYIKQSDVHVLSCQIVTL